MSDVKARPVVVGVDGSESGLRAARWAAGEASRRRVGLRLVRACEVPTGHRPGLVDPNALREAVAEEGRRSLARALDAVEPLVSDVDVDTALEFGPSVPLLVTESADASVLVLGNRGLGGFTGLLVGSTSVELAGRASCPVVVVRGRDDDDPPADGPVVVGVDGTELSEAALEFAFAEAADRGDGLIAVHAWADPVLETAFAATAVAFDAATQAGEAERSLTGQLAAWREKHPDVPVTAHVVRERPAHALLRFAEGARLVVVGSRGRGGFRGLLLGSTSRHLLHHAPCPVAVVRAPRL